MSLIAQCGWTAARATVVGLACVSMGSAVRLALPRPSERFRPLAWLAFLAPCLTPSLLVGYAYAGSWFSLVRHPAWNELLYTCLLWMRLVPVAALVLYVAPSPVSPEAVHCRRLARTVGGRLHAHLSYVRFLLHGPMRVHAVAFAVAFLLAFAEFELGSLLGVGTWAVSLFDAHAGGLALTESLRLGLLPAAVAGVVFLTAAVVLFGGGRLPSALSARAPSPGRAARTVTLAYGAAALAVSVLVPAAVVLRGTAQGMGVLFQDFVLWRDVGASLVFAGAAAACAYAVSGPLAGLARSGRLGSALVAGLALPGLLGTLVLSLLVVGAFQAPALRGAYDTPVPLLMALCAAMLPLALLVRLLLSSVTPGSRLHAVRLLAPAGSPRVGRARRRLVWELAGKQRFWAFALLFCWCFYELTASSVLAPAAMTPVSVRLYNLMHYGQTAVLSAMVCVSLCVPLALLVLARGAQSTLMRLAAHG